MNTQINITENGTTTLATAGKYCDRNIDVNVNVPVGDNYYDTFWDAYQSQGTRDSYRYAFAGFGWTDEIFKPKYNIVNRSSGDSMFAYSRIRDMKSCLESCGVTLDLSKSTYTGYFAMYCSYLTTLPKIDLSSATSNTSTFYNCPVLKTIDELVVSENTVFQSSFNLCPALENMIVTGTLAKNGFDVQWSTKLSKASIESIINALSSTTSGLTVTISKTAKEAAFTAEEWSALIATKTNWTISLA
jgi:hypothetical protein